MNRLTLALALSLYFLITGFAMAQDKVVVINMPSKAFANASGVDWSKITNKPAGLDDGDDNTQLSEAQVDSFVSNNGYLTTENELPTQTGNSGKFLKTDGTNPSWNSVSYNDLTDVPANIDTDSTDDFDGNYSSLSGAPANVSSFTNDAGYLTTESELPSQTGNSGKYLTTDGTSVSWASVTTEKELYIPANMFRPVLSATAWSFEEEGAIINPNDASYWIAPILLPVGTTIISLELVFKNEVANTGISTVIMHLLNEADGIGVDTYTQSSSATEAGVNKVLCAVNWVVSSTNHASVRVYLGNTFRWLLGVKVVYSN